MVVVSIPLWSDYKLLRRWFFDDATIVSIPLWSDYKRFMSSDSARSRRVSIPLWSDYKVRPAMADAVSPLTFQFHFGPIIRLRRFLVSCSQNFVSIPLWSDYKAGTLLVARKLRFVSIPLWSDYKSTPSESVWNSSEGFNSTLVRL